MSKHDHDVDAGRRGFLKCMAWAGTGAVWAVRGGVPVSRLLGAEMHPGDSASFHFVQISDSHIGFNKPANDDVVATLQQAVDQINALSDQPDFLIHTGDLTHLSKPGEFDTLDQVLRSVRAGRHFFVPGEHDVFADQGKLYLERHGKGTKGSGWFSFDHKGVHFAGLVNVADLKAGGMGTLGQDQLSWLKDDLSSYSDSTPVVVFAHIPLWTVYPEWGWGTDDSEQALGYLRRFGSVTVLNGHIHQIMQKVEGSVSFHTARSTAFPQPAPGTAPSPGPMVVPAGQLRNVLGTTSVRFVPGNGQLAIVDSSLASGAAAATGQVSIDNFAFTPSKLRVDAGTAVTWTNRDDVPHTVVSTERKFSSPVLDTDQKFTFSFREPGRYGYYCSLHPRMTGEVVVSGQ
jgi:Icc protein